MALKLKLANGKEALKEYSENVLLGDYSDYRKSLKALQLSINETLSALVVNESGKKPTCGVYCVSLKTMNVLELLKKTLLASDSEGSDLEEASSKRALSKDRGLAKRSKNTSC